MDEIILKNIKLKGKHGCFAHEMETPCDFLVSMKLRLDLQSAAKTDLLENTIDYPAAASIAEGVLAGESVRLIERIADEIAKRMFVRFARLMEIEIRVQKKTAELNIEIEEVAVKLFRKRGDYI